jgi:hypothetical protein
LGRKKCVSSFAVFNCPDAGTREPRDWMFVKFAAVQFLLPIRSSFA